MFYDDNGVRVSQHSISYPAGALSVHRVIDIAIERETVDDRDGTHRFWKLVGKVVQFAGFGIAFLPFIAVMWTLVLTVLFYLGIEIESAPGDYVRNPNWSDYGPFEPEPWTFWAICGAGILSGLLVGLLGGLGDTLGNPQKNQVLRGPGGHRPGCPSISRPPRRTGIGGKVGFGHPGGGLQRRQPCGWALTTWSDCPNGTGHTKGIGSGNQKPESSYGIFSSRSTPCITSDRGM